MIVYKSRAELDLMKVSADLLGRAHGEVAKHVKPGVTTKFLDKIAEEFIKDHKAWPSFLDYSGFPASLCISKNDVVVHGIPDDKELIDGDIVSIDCGVFLNGFHADSAFTYAVGDVKEEIQSLLKVTKECLYLGIDEVKAGNRIGDVSFAVQSHAEQNGYTVVRELVGHGVGKNLHEDPQVPNYGRRGQGPKLKDGIVLAIEPMINLGKRNVVQENDGWTIRTKDRKASAHFEHTVALWEGKPEVLTTFKYIEEVLSTNYA